MNYFWVFCVVHEETLRMIHIRNTFHYVSVNYEQYSNLKLVGPGELVFERAHKVERSHTVIRQHKSVYFRNYKHISSFPTNTEQY